MAKPGQGALGFIAQFMEDNLRSAPGSARPWVLLEAPDRKRLFVAGFPVNLRMAVADGKIIWVRVTSAAQMPEILLMLLESGLCAGVLLRGFGQFMAEHPHSGIWARRWQLDLERTGTHLLWWHDSLDNAQKNSLENPQENSLVLGKTLKLRWNNSQQIEIIRGWSYFESFQLLKKLSQKIINPLKNFEKGETHNGQQQDGGQFVNRKTA